MQVQYSFSNNKFIIKNYDKAKAFAGFLPGIAGADGVPLWAFYVNRGQVMGAFGVRDKNGAIMEFFPANIMYRNIERQGFRTFIKKNGEVHEIFSSASQDPCERILVIDKNAVRIVEENHALGIRATVTYFTMPAENFAALVRKAEFERMDEKGMCEIEILDGLPQILPCGIGSTEYQAIANLARSWFDVCNLENNIAYYKVRSTIADTTEVGVSDSGNFYLAFSSESDGLIPPIFDMDAVFGRNTALTRPDAWDAAADRLHEKRQVPENKVSGGFAGVRTTLGDRGRFVLCSILGHASNPEMINRRARDFAVDYVNRKEEEAEKLVEGLVADVYTKTAIPEFDMYIGQCYLDNFLRGGYPVIFKPGGVVNSGGEKHGGGSVAGNNIVYHLFSRKHGDLEREYNFFSLEPSFYSQGNGNYRDVNQNRRNDVLVKPEVADFNVKQMMSLIQADGYNPLIVKGCSFVPDREAIKDVMKLVRTQKEKVKKILDGRYTPGSLLTCIRDSGAEMACGDEDFLLKALAASRQEFEAEFGEGFWSDHWTYNMDLVETFLEIYPDMEEKFLFDDAVYRFYHGPAYVLPREDKYVLVDGKVRRHGAVRREDGGTEGRGSDETRWLRKSSGKGEIYETNLFAKLVLLAVIKFATLDPSGMGIEMEAGKPGWNDALNGLPALFGSGLGETIELKRLVDFIAKACLRCDREVRLFTEAADLMKKIAGLLDGNLAGDTGDFEYWDNVSRLKEEYGNRIRNGIEGKEESFGTKDLLGIFRKFGKKLAAGLEKALAAGNGIYPTYFMFEAAEYEVIAGKTSPVGGYPNVRIKRFECKPLPPFLEAPARMLKITRDVDEAGKIYEKVKTCGIYDRKLKMYKTSVPLDGLSIECGRLMAFTPGWLERESVFLHMEYKYLYGMLKAGLYDEFFNDMRTMLVPFMKPEVYGRSVIENSSFIASSENPDDEQHGRGFVARMTGTNAEMISIWFMMMAGKNAFRCENGSLILELAPVLPGWMFDGDGKVVFRFLGKTDVTYINPERKNTYGSKGAKPVKYVLGLSCGAVVEIDGPSVGRPYAEMARNGEIDRIEVLLG